MLKCPRDIGVFWQANAQEKQRPRPSFWAKVNSRQKRFRQSGVLPHTEAQSTGWQNHHEHMWPSKWMARAGGTQSLRPGVEGDVPTPRVDGGQELLSEMGDFPKQTLTRVLIYNRSQRNCSFSKFEMSRNRILWCNAVKIGINAEVEARLLVSAGLPGWSFTGMTLLVSLYLPCFNRTHLQGQVPSPIQPITKISSSLKSFCWCFGFIFTCLSPPLQCTLHEGRDLFCWVENFILKVGITSWPSVDWTMSSDEQQLGIGILCYKDRPMHLHCYHSYSFHSL